MFRLFDFWKKNCYWTMFAYHHSSLANIA